MMHKVYSIVVICVTLVLMLTNAAPAQLISLTIGQPPPAPPDRFIDLERTEGGRIALRASLIGGVFSGGENSTIVCHNGTSYFFSVEFYAFLHQIGWDTRPEIIYTTDGFFGPSAFDPAKVTVFYYAGPGYSSLSLQGCTFGTAVAIDYDTLVQQLSQ